MSTHWTEDEDGEYGGVGSRLQRNTHTMKKDRDEGGRFMVLYGNKNGEETLIWAWLANKTVKQSKTTRSY